MQIREQPHVAGSSIFHQRVGLLKDFILAHLIIIIICYFWPKLFFKRDKNRENAGALSQWSLKNYYVTFQGYINIYVSIIMCSSY